jgi:hypothetical protein
MLKLFRNDYLAKPIAVGDGRDMNDYVLKNPGADGTGRRMKNKGLRNDGPRLAQVFSIIV